MHHNTRYFFPCVLWALISTAPAAPAPIANAQLSGSSAVVSGTLSIGGSAKLVSEASSIIDLRLGTVQLPAAVSLLGSSIDLGSEVTGSLPWASVSKSGSTLADLATRSASDLISGTLPDARFPATLPALNGSAITNLNASALASGTAPAARLPVMIGDTGSGGTQGAVPAPATGDATKVLYGDGTWQTPPGAAGGEANTASNLGTGSDGEGVYSGKSGVDLQFKRLKAGSGITLTATTNSITITASGGSGSNDSPDNFPGSANAMDDEFSGNSLDGKWSWLNQGGASVTFGGGRLLLYMPGVVGSYPWRGIYQTAPSAPWTVRTKITLPAKEASVQLIGLALRNSSTGKFLAWVAQYHSGYSGYGMLLSRQNSATSSASEALGEHLQAQTFWLQAASDGTTLTYSISIDGANFRQIGTETIASFVGAVDEIGIVSCVEGASVGGPTFSVDWFRRIN